MVTADDDGGRHFAVGNQLVEQQARLVALPVAQPADAGGQTFELHVLLCGVEPAVQVVVVREELLERFVSHPNIFRISGQGDPAEGAEALAEQRSDVGRHKAGELKGTVITGLAGFIADGVAVVEHDRALVLEADHCGDVLGHRLLRAQGELFGVLFGFFRPFVHADTKRQVGQGVVC